MRYYSITIIRRSDGQRAGERFYNAHAPLSIGQQASADVHLPCDDDLLPQCLCTILHEAELDCWYVVRKSDFYRVTVGGEEVDYIRSLRDGDTIQVDGCTLAFHTHDDDNYVEGQGLLRTYPGDRWRRMLVWGLSLLVVLAISIGYPLLRGRMHTFTTADKAEVRSSVYTLVVGEYILQSHVRGDAQGVFRTVDSYESDSLSVGTCFFTCDSLCVTARHCVEPWIDFAAWPDSITTATLPKEVGWAIMAERSQLEQSDTVYRLVTRCRVMDGDTCIYEFTSADCKFNRSRDIIARLGDEGLPWRIVYPLYSRKDVELGDFAFVKTCRKGALQLATDTYLTALGDDDDGEVRIFGFPRTNYGNEWDTQLVSDMKMPQMEADGYDRCIQLTVDATSGYSGAPVVVKRGGQMMVVGIFSKIDDFVDSMNKYYAVPANEVSQYNQEANYGTKQYRR